MQSQRSHIVQAESDTRVTVDQCRLLGTAPTPPPSRNLDLATVGGIIGESFHRRFVRPQWLVSSRVRFHIAAGQSRRVATI